MKYDTLPTDSDGKHTLPCCGVRLRVKTWPINCSCKHATGLGDTLAAFFKRIGIKPKKGCKCPQRQETLNRWFPY